MNTNIKRQLVVRHPEYQMCDEVRIRLVERWKESELSGDEWRFSYLVEFLHKGVALGTKTFGDRMEWALLGAGAAYLGICDNGVPNELFELEKHVCAQPGCQNEATHVYRVKALYDNRGNKEELPREYDALGVEHVIRFCGRHKHRGDCDLQDCDSNYELLQS